MSLENYFRSFYMFMSLQIIINLRQCCIKTVSNSSSEKTIVIGFCFMAFRISFNVSAAG